MGFCGAVPWIEASDSRSFVESQYSFRFSALPGDADGTVSSVVQTNLVRLYHTYIHTLTPGSRAVIRSCGSPFDVCPLTVAQRISLIFTTWNPLPAAGLRSVP